MDMFSLILIVGLLLNLLFIIILIFIERKDATTTWAWLFVLYFLPFVGSILYLLFGQDVTRRNQFKKEAAKKIGIGEAISSQKKQVEEPNFSFDIPTVEQYRELVDMHLIHHDALLAIENDVELIIDGQDKFDRLLKDIQEAKQFIHIQYYLFSNDEIGAQLIRLLTEKANEGVSVRFLYDDLGSAKLKKSHLSELKAAGGEVVIFFPSKIPFINFRLNYRNHRKLVNIDGRIGYVGGFNVGVEYLGKDKKFGYWRDTHLRIEGDAVKPLQTKFIQDWNQASKEKRMTFHKEYFPEVKGQNVIPMQIVSSGPDSEGEEIKYGYLKMIMAAKESIYIQTPYFIPDIAILDALRVAVLSGIDVRIMIPNKPDGPFVYWATYAHIGEMLKTGAKVYQYERGFIHSKTIVVDRKISSVGTANFDMRSFQLNFEINSFIYHDETSDKLAKAFEVDMEVSKEITYELYQKRSNWVKCKEAFSTLLSPIL
ncbi:cardiolipin synthase [Halalkalibacter nanhaiisediminis]|uniref:Cardiolipin synthase n=1 Tax=Halalkalibacter nanhaiisediminis TaxID=688079 RepID=A0A562QCT8_9BACI|nr:cardiolipin synthase [Halalkalibacter nanhaiisediminis]TWI54544.1 cardiolipin synthase [Halalkalibacter nanhaiisediminis]